MRTAPRCTPRRWCAAHRVVRFSGSSPPPADRTCRWWACRPRWLVQPGTVQRQPSLGPARPQRRRHLARPLDGQQRLGPARRYPQPLPGVGVQAPVAEIPEAPARGQGQQLRRQARLLVLEHALHLERHRDRTARMKEEVEEVDRSLGLRRRLSGGFGGAFPHFRGGRIGIPAAHRYALAVPRRTPVSASMRRSAQPRRPSARICSRFSLPKTFAIAPADPRLPPRVNVRGSAPSVGSPPSSIGRFWVSTEDQATSGPHGLRPEMHEAPTGFTRALGSVHVRSCMRAGGTSV